MEGSTCCLEWHFVGPADAIPRSISTNPPQIPLLGVQRIGAISAAMIRSIAAALPITGSLAIRCTIPEMLPKPTYNIFYLVLCSLGLADVGKLPLAERFANLPMCLRAIGVP